MKDSFIIIVTKFEFSILAAGITWELDNYLLNEWMSEWMGIWVLANHPNK